jgi:hypothetical protein
MLKGTNESVLFFATKFYWVWFEIWYLENTSISCIDYSTC